jgi:hypothetical protein
MIECAQKSYVRTGKISQYQTPAQIGRDAFLGWACLSVSILVIALCMLLGGPVSLFSWSACLAIGIQTSQWFCRQGFVNATSSNLFLISYLLTSLLGFLIVLDNQLNFGVPFGYARDDQMFFEAVCDLRSGHTLSEFGLYEAGLATWSFLVRPFDPVGLNLTDLLPINWLFTALCVVVLNDIAVLVSRQAFPAWLTVAALLGNMRFADSNIRLYRDAIILFFVATSILLVLRKRHAHGLLYLLPVFVLRGANGFLALTFAIMLWTKRRIESRAMFAILTGAFLLISIFATTKSNQLNLYAFTSDIARLGRYLSAFEDVTLSEQLARRSEAIAEGTEHAGANNLIHQAYANGGTMASLVKPIYTIFFPLTFHAPRTTMHVAENISPNRVVEGYYLYYVIEWAWISIWVVVLPYLILGGYRMLTGTDEQLTIILFYILSVVAVAFVSGQIRHACAFVILHPLLVACGYQAVKLDRNLRTIFPILTWATVALILAWNLVRHGSN